MNETKADRIFWIVLFSISVILTLVLMGVTALGIKENFGYQEPLVGAMAGFFMTYVFWGELKKRIKKREP